MNDAKKGIPEIGQTVWVKMTCARHSVADPDHPWGGTTSATGYRLWPHRNVEWLPDPLPTAAPRQPWDVLREAAALLYGKAREHTASVVLTVADTMEREASPPDPLDIVRRIAALPSTQNDHTLIDDARRCLAAHEKKEV